MKNIGLTIVALVGASACTPPEPAADAAGGGASPAAAVPTVAAVTTPAVAHGAPVNAAFWRNPGEPADTRLLAAAGIAGVQVYGLDGSRLGQASGVEAGMLAVVPEMRAAGEAAPLVVVYDGATSTIGGFRLEGEASLTPVMGEPIPVRDELTGLCHYRSRLAARDYLYAVTDGGLLHHYELFERDGAVGARLLRTVPSGKGSGFCAVDPRDGALYVSEEGTGIWRLGAEPESDPTREPLDMRVPFGALSDDLKGVGIYPAAPDRSWLVVADAGDGRLVIYRLPDGERLAAVAVEGLAEPEGLAVTPAAGGAWPRGVLAVADEGAGDGDGPNVKLVDWRALAQAAGLADPAAAATAEAPPVVRPVAETDVVASYGDAADDPAIWVHPADPSQSLVIGTDKKAGLYVFDLDGRTLQVLEDGRMNNVDVRDGFPLGGETVPLVIASNRSNDGIAVYRIDVAARRLVEVADGVLDTGFSDPYGACLYRSAQSGEFYAFVNEGSLGDVRQWRLFDNGAGRVSAERVREFSVGSQAEGCVADDRTGALYVAEEDVGLWRYAAAPEGGDERVLIDGTGDDGRLTGDVEGVALLRHGDGSGYLVASNQGANDYAVYRREGDNAFLGIFHIVANAAEGYDGASETDGLDVTGVALGDAYPRGLLVVQDGRNIAPEEPQNFKFVSWADVEAALELD